jgi:glycosyltransferase involved in cell wall biosynthesis
MKIAIITLGRRGSSPVYSIEMTQALLSSKEDVKLLVIVSTYTCNIAHWRLLANKYSNIVVIEVETYRNTREFLFSYFRIRTFFKIIKTINEYNPLALYSTMNHFWDILIFPFVRAQKIRTIHDVKIHKGESNYLLQQLANISLKQADKIILLSNVFVNDILKVKKFTKNDIGVIPHANFGYYTGDNKIEITQTFHNKILFFGRIIKYKGIKVLLMAMKQIVEKFPNIKLIIAGNGDISNYSQLLAELKDNIELHIKIIPENEVYSYFKNIDFVVLPYIEATQSGVIPLSYSMGKPVICTNVGGLPEQVFNNTGILIPPNDVNALIAAIELLISDKNLLYKMSCEALKIAETELSWKISAEKLINYIKLWTAPLD